MNSNRNHTDELYLTLFILNTDYNKQFQKFFSQIYFIKMIYIGHFFFASKRYKNFKYEINTNISLKKRQINIHNLLKVWMFLMQATVTAACLLFHDEFVVQCQFLSR